VTAAVVVDGWAMVAVGVGAKKSWSEGSSLGVGAGMGGRGPGSSKLVQLVRGCDSGAALACMHSN